VTPENEKLIEAAKEVRNHSHSPYSNFKVGAAIRTQSGKIYTGCNVENATLWASLCAERVAISKAVSEGETNFEIIAIVTDSEKPALPCGGCRQVLSEFSQLTGKDIKIIAANCNGQIKETSLQELLPEPFGAKDLF